MAWIDAAGVRAQNQADASKACAQSDPAYPRDAFGKPQVDKHGHPERRCGAEQAGIHQRDVGKRKIIGGKAEPTRQ